MDWDGDRDIDLSVFYAYLPLQNQSLPIRVWLNNGAGVFTDGTAMLFPNGAPRTTHPRGDVVADFNGDHRPDLFIADHGYDVLPPLPGFQNQLVLSSGASGVVNATSTLPQISDYSHSTAAGDIDRDGDIDLIVMNIYGGSPLEGQLTNPYFLLNNGQGQFTRADWLPADIAARNFGMKFTSVALIDADQDGDADLVLGSHGELLSARSLILLNPGNGDFTNAQRLVLPPGPAATVPTVVVSITTGDFDMDGDQDVILNHNGNDQHYYFQMMINQGGGQFADETQQRLPQNYAASTTWIEKLQAADINGDGFVDLIASRRGFPPVYLNDGAGRFVQLPASYLNYNGWGFPEFLNHMPVDVNGDGRMDIVADSGYALLVFTALDPGLQQDGTATADALMGDSSNETLNGFSGDDVLFSAQGDDTLDGGAGMDNVNGGAGSDVIIVRFGEFAAGEVADGGVGSDILRSFGSIDYRAGAVRNFERIQFRQAGVEATINIIFNASQLAGLSSTLTLTGSAAQDSVQVFAAPGQTVDVSGWQFEFPGWEFQDYIVYVGDTGNESFVGWGGLDIYFGSPGNDVYDGRGAFDFAAYIFSPNAVTADLAIAGPQAIGGNQGSDTFINLEGLAGSQLGDTLSGDAQNNIILSLGGDDTVNGRAGEDDLRGGDGNDRIEGGLGSDALQGEAGVDRFVYRTALEGGDTIVDFQAGIDRIEVSASGFGLTAGAAVQFSASANPAVSGTGPQFAYDTDDGFLYFDPDGTGAQQAIRLATLANSAAITGSDIVVTSIPASFIEADDLPLAKADADQQPEVSLADVLELGETFPPPLLGPDTLHFS